MRKFAVAVLVSGIVAALSMGRWPRPFRSSTPS
jgi:hypothetical protein